MNECGIQPLNKLLDNSLLRSVMGSVDTNNCYIFCSLERFPRESGIHPSSLLLSKCLLKKHESRFDKNKGKYIYTSCNCKSFPNDSGMVLIKELFDKSLFFFGLVENSI